MRSRTLLLLGSSSISLLGNGELDTLALGQRDERLVALADDEDVGQSGDKLVVKSVLDVDNVEAALVSLSVGDGADSAHVSTSGGHDDVTVLKLDERGDLAGGQVDLDGVVDLDEGIRVSDGSAVVGDEVGDSLLADLDSLDLTELVSSLLIGDSVDGKSALDVVDKSEVLTSLLELDDIHEASGEGGVGSDLAVDLDQSLHENGVDLSTVQGVLETVSQEDDERQRLSQLVGTGRRSGGVGAGQLVQHPVGGSCESLEMLLAGVSRFLVAEGSVENNRTPSLHFPEQPFVCYPSFIQKRWACLVKCLIFVVVGVYSRSSGHFCVCGVKEKIGTVVVYFSGPGRESSWDSLFWENAVTSCDRAEREDVHWQSGPYKT